MSSTREQGLGLCEVGLCFAWRDLGICGLKMDLGILWVSVGVYYGKGGL